MFFGIHTQSSPDSPRGFTRTGILILIYVHPGFRYRYYIRNHGEFYCNFMYNILSINEQHRRGMRFSHRGGGSENILFCNLYSARSASRTTLSITGRHFSANQSEVLSLSSLYSTNDIIT